MTIIEGEIIPPTEPKEEIVVHDSQPVFRDPDADRIVVDHGDSASESDPDNPAAGYALVPALSQPLGPEPTADQSDANPGEAETADGPDAPAENELTEEEFDALKALVSLLVGGAIEGTSQLTTRLQQYQEEINQAHAEQEADGSAESAETAVTEDEFVRLRYALVGFIFDTQARVKRTMPLLSRLIDTSTRVGTRAARPVTKSRFFAPIQRRYNDLALKGEENIKKWIDIGRQAEPPSRELAKMTYVNIVDEFISQLAENPELQGLVQAQSIGLATEVRDEVRGRGVTADTVLENLVRKVLRRAPREELPTPPPEVQKWAGATMEDFRANQRKAEQEKYSNLDDDNK